MRILLLTGGSHGDIHPYAAIARALKRRGADAAIMTNRYYQAELDAAGIELVHAHADTLDVGQFMRDNPWMNNPRLAGRRLIARILVPILEEWLDRFVAEVDRQRPDLVLVHPLAVVGPPVCAQRGIPWVSTSLSPMTWLSRHEHLHPFALPFVGLRQPPWLSRAFRAMAITAMHRWIDTPFNRILTRRGLPTFDHHFLAAARGTSPDPRAPSAALNLGLWSPTFRGPKPDDPPNSVITGFPWFDQSEINTEPNPALERFLASGEPPIVFTLGTTSVHAPGRFYQDATATAQRLNRRAILLTGRGNEPPPGLPPTILAVPYAPYSTLLPRAAATVHHGGIGSTAQGLRSGRPTLIAPHAHDQFDNAARAQRLGCSLTLLKRTPRHLEHALRQLLDHPSYAHAAAALAPRIAPDGAESAATHLLQIAAPALSSQP